MKLKSRVYALNVFVVIFLLFTTSCEMESGGSGSGVTPGISFEDSSGSSSKNMTPKEITLTPSESLQPLIDFYNNSDNDDEDIGSLVDSYTPSKFELFIQEIVLYNDSEAYELDIPLSEESAEDHSRHIADFINDVVIQPEVPIAPGTYTGLFFFFFTSNGALSVGGTIEDPAYVINYTPSVVVELPGYGNVNNGNFSDEPSSNDPSIYDRQNISEDKYHFAPSLLLPNAYQDLLNHTLGTDGVSYNGDISMFAYRHNDTYRAILPDIEGHPEIWSTADEDTIGLSNHGSTGNSGAVIMPGPKIDIPSDAKGITFKVSWDLEGIIEVYDANTPDIKSDDIVVLADKFWERFSLIPEVY